MQGFGLAALALASSAIKSDHSFTILYRCSYAVHGVLFAIQKVSKKFLRNAQTRYNELMRTLLHIGRRFATFQSSCQYAITSELVHNHPLRNSWVSPRTVLLSMRNSISPKCFVLCCKSNDAECDPPR